MDTSKKPQSGEGFQLGKIILEGLPQFVGYEILFRLLAATLLTPLIAGLASALIGLSGSGAISNYDIIGFLLSFKGLLYLTAVISTGFLLTFLEFGGLLTLVLAMHRGTQVSLPVLLRHQASCLWPMWRLSLRQFLAYLLIAAPCLTVFGGTYLALLTESDINYYLIAKPSEFWITSGVGIICGLVFLGFAGYRFIDWIFSIPLLLLTDASPAQALLRSHQMAQSRRKHLIIMLLRWVGLSLAAFLVLGLVLALIKALLLGIAGNRVGLVLSLISVLAVFQFIAILLVGVLISSTLACSIMRYFIEWCPSVELPKKLQVDEPSVVCKAIRLMRISWGALILLLVASGAVAWYIMSTKPDPILTGVTAHRGSSITAPENTMAAIMLAVEEGADYVEIDVQETKDGTVVLVHDKDLRRIFGIKKGIWEVTYDELKNLDSGSWFSSDFSDQRIVTLDQVIKAVKGRVKLNIELKFNGHQKQLAKEVVRIIRENGFTEDCILTSLDYSGILRARKAGPEFQTGLIVSSALGDVTELDIDIISVSAGSLTRDLIDRAHHAGLEVHVWTVNDVALMNRMLGMGVHQIVTDDPKLLREVIAKRSALSSAELTLLRLAEIANNRIAWK